MSTPDPFSTFDRMLSRYKRDVHQLEEPATVDAIIALEAHLGWRVPSGLRAMLQRCNGAHLFRGALTLRGTSAFAPASPGHRSVWVFADGQDGERWVFARGHGGEHVFGRWVDGAVLPLHATFFGWLDATLAVLEARVVRDEDRVALRMEADPDDAWQLFHAGQRALAAGRPEDAVPLLERATRAHPGNVLAWQRLGDALAGADRVASRRAMLTALHAQRIPLDWPGAPLIDVDLFSTLARAFSDPEGWEHELQRFLNERVTDVHALVEFDVVVQAATALADSLVRRGRRSAARAVLAELVDRTEQFRLRQTPWRALVDLASVEIDLGHHDEAEKHLRTVRLEGPAALAPTALALLGKLAVMREEPWAEEILDDALAAVNARDRGDLPPLTASDTPAMPDEDARIHIALLRVERAARQNRKEEAAQWLEAAKRWVEQGAPRHLRAATALAEGDVLRMSAIGHTADGGSSPWAAAHAAYRRAAELLGDRPAPELRHRIELRFGDIALAEGDREDAQIRFRAAAAGFAGQELPVREAWALVRLARVSPDPAPALHAARSHFLEADLAAGVAVVDALSGQPAASLSWHLERASEHASARYNAQRAKPPWTRSDAERPERRLGAHRMAIAACGEAVVETLTAEMDAASRAIRAGRGRPLDPPVLRYTAAVDLLAGHRSYAAAQALLRDLVEARVEGVARVALQGAIARSPNAALVDGLLGCLENPGHVPATAVAAAAEVLGLRREQEASPALRALAVPGQNPLVRKAAITALGRIGRRDAIAEVAAGLDDAGLAEGAALALLMLGDRRGIDFHARALSEQRHGLQGHPGEIVGRYGGPSHLLVLAPAAASGDEDVALGALQGLGLMGDPRGVPYLLRALDPHEARTTPRRSEVAAGALQILTGHHEDPESTNLHRRWVAWWEVQHHRFPAGVRHRHGKVFDLGTLLQAMEGDDPWLRRTAYDELVIATGERLPFDADGPWRVQLAHLRAWRAWWQAQRARFPAGRWYLDGRPIDG